MKVSTMRLGDVATLNPPWPSHSVVSDELVAFAPMAAVSAHTSEEFISETRLFSSLQNGFSYFRDHDVLVAKITPCFENGKITQARIQERHGFGSTEFHVVRAHEDRVDPRYLTHFLRQDWVRLKGQRRMTGSAGQRRVPKDFLARLEIPIPPLLEQIRIGAILDKADALRAKRRQALAKLDALTQSLFLDLFGDPTTNPRSWPIRRIGELIIDGPQNGLYKPSTDYGSGVPILRIDAFYDGAVTDISTLKRVRVASSEAHKFRLVKDDVVINRVNSLEYLGKCAIIPELSEQTVFESNMMRMRFDVNRALPRFVVQFLQTAFIRSQVLMCAKHAVNQASINQQDVTRLRVQLPPIELQHKFIDRLAVLEKVTAVQRSSFSRLDALFSTLQHRAFQGEL